jgi:hypothetical protein
MYKPPPSGQVACVSCTTLGPVMSVAEAGNGVKQVVFVEHLPLRSHNPPLQAPRAASSETVLLRVEQ